MGKLQETFLRLRYRNRSGNLCGHLAWIQEVTPSAQGCEDCLKIGDTWVHLRICKSCGHVGCCDNSKNKHATRHFHETGHPIIQSFEPGETWMWCYIDEVMW
ncbi:MAG: UBP-type zinc finger domain-containing protein [Chloroflexi bacterium]|nr:UBP-type zinc finger domain-containing protein [Chloroflexota bacterium]